MKKEITKENVSALLSRVLPQIDFSNSNEPALDSVSMVLLVSELAFEYDVEFDVDKLEPKNFANIDAIVETMKGLQK